MFLDHDKGQIIAYQQISALGYKAAIEARLRGDFFSAILFSQMAEREAKVARFMMGVE